MIKNYNLKKSNKKNKDNIKIHMGSKMRLKIS